MSQDIDLQKMIAEAEAAVPPQEVTFTIGSPVEAKDIDQIYYERLRANLPPVSRLKLAADYELYREVKGTLAQLRSIAMAYCDNPDGSTIGPVVSRLMRTLVRPVAQWRVCGHCAGSGEHKQVGKCTTCGGNGYVIY